MTTSSTQQRMNLFRQSEIFDAGWYVSEYPDVALLRMDPVEHYVRYGERLRRSPGPTFDTRYYLQTYPDVDHSGVSPLEHYVCQGHTEGRQTRAPGKPLTKTRRELPRENASVLAEYIPRLDAPPLQHKPVRLIAFYLPQFHAIAENNAWWGEGFTEWRNVKPAEPQYHGHYQPHVPGELGYYSLLDASTQRRQIELAKLYGVEGFCFYFYWFGGKRLLETPVRNYLNDPSLDLPFCLCWANENWSRRWDGLDSEILIAQQHSSEDDLAFIGHIAEYLKDPRYIRINGKPLVLVYRPSLLPSASATAALWRDWCRCNGIGDIYLAYTQSFEAVDPAEYGFDAAIEFPPNNSAPPNVTSEVEPIAPDFACTVYDWNVLVERSRNYQAPGYKLFRSVCPSWDNTARRKNRATIFKNSSPGLYREWLGNAVVETERQNPDPEDRLVFVNAWNEWAEGAHLEPDQRYGYAFLQATRDALDRTSRFENPCVLIATHDCHPHGAQFLILETARKFKDLGFKVSILALEGGRLLPDFSAVGDTLNVREAGQDRLHDFLSRQRAAGFRDAITSTVVCGSLVPLLKQHGFDVLSLIHELPGVIRSMKQEGNAAMIAQFADKVVFPADMVWKKFCEIAAVDEAKTVIRPQGLLRTNPYKHRRDEARAIVLEKHGLPADAHIVLSIGFLDERKGPDLFVEAAAEVVRHRSDVYFIWVGHVDEAMHGKVLRRIGELGLEQRVHLTGFDKEPLAYYAAASVYALTSREDPFPNVVLESAEVALPVVAFQGASGAGDFVLQQGGRLARQFDTTEYAQHVLALLDLDLKVADQSVAPLRQYALDLLHHINGFPRVSVIVPNYNYETHIEARLESIARQSFPYYELQVLDDASTDGSVSVIQGYLRRCGDAANLVVNATNSGSVFRQWRKGAGMVRGDLVWIAEADDLAEREFLAVLVAGFLRSTDVAMAFCQSQQVDEHGNVLAPDYLAYTDDVSDIWRRSYCRPGKDEIRDALAVKNTVPNVSAVLFKRDALVTALQELGEGLFNHRIAGDWFVYMRVLLRGSIYFHAKSLNLHRRHAASVTQSTRLEGHFREVCRAQDEAMLLVAPTQETSRKASTYREYLRKHFGLHEPIDLETTA